MKPKKFSNKLILNKKTITNLNQGDLGAVRGGNKTGITCVPRGCDTVFFSCEESACPTCAPSCFYTECQSECAC